jgi:hypothetical protein
MSARSNTSLLIFKVFILHEVTKSLFFCNIFDWDNVTAADSSLFSGLIFVEITSELPVVKIPSRLMIIESSPTQFNASLIRKAAMPAPPLKDVANWTIFII